MKSIPLRSFGYSPNRSIEVNSTMTLSDIRAAISDINRDWNLKSRVKTTSIDGKLIYKIIIL